jgi:CBS domain containing-hemolysin-like protein
MMLQLLFLLALLALSGFFSASETALFSLSRRDLRRLGREPGVVDSAIRGLREDPQGLLSTVLFGNTLVNVLYFAVATVVAADLESSGATVAMIALGVGSLIGVIICGEVVPKAIAVAIPLRFSRLAAVPLLFFHRVILPVRRALRVMMRVSEELAGAEAEPPHLTPEELKLLIHATGERGELHVTERDLMHEIIEFAEIRVREVMVPRVDVAAFDVDDSLDEFRAMVEEKGFGHVPVYEGNIDSVIGVVRSRDVLLSDTTDLREHLRPIPLFVPELARIEPILHQFRERRCQFAVVVDEYGGWAGIVTLEDIIEEIVGDISDEFDADVQPVVELGPDCYELSGGVSIRDWTEIFDLDLDPAAVETLGGFLVLQLERLPRQGDVVELGNLRFTVVAVSRRRVARVRIERFNGNGADG